MMHLLRTYVQFHDEKVILWESTKQYCCSSLTDVNFNLYISFLFLLIENTLEVFGIQEIQ